MTEETRNGLTFSQWMEKVNHEIYILTEGTFCHNEDFEDWCSWDCWDSECSPEEGAFDCVSNDFIGEQLLEELGKL
jgi:hypothetical protein